MAIVTPTCATQGTLELFVCVVDMIAINCFNWFFINKSVLVSQGLSRFLVTALRRDRGKRKMTKDRGRGEEESLRSTSFEEHFV